MVSKVMNESKRRPRIFRIIRFYCKRKLYVQTPFERNSINRCVGVAVFSGWVVVLAQESSNTR